jgi:cytochrome c oxidase subunit 1
MAHAHEDEPEETYQPKLGTSDRLAFVDRYPDAALIVRLCFGVSFGSLGIGALFGVIQALHRTNVFRGIIDSADYYTVLTGHGVLLALFFTIFFLAGIFTWGTTRSLERDVISRRFSLLWFSLMFLGAGATALAIFGGFVGSIPFSADVLYTFYAPMHAHPLFYIGLTSFLMGT